MNSEMFRVEILLDGMQAGLRGPYGRLGDARRVRNILRRQVDTGDTLGFALQEVRDRVKIRISRTAKNPKSGRWGMEWTQIEGDL